MIRNRYKNVEENQLAENISSYDKDSTDMQPTPVLVYRSQRTLANPASIAL